MNDLEKAENGFLRLNLEEGFIMAKGVPLEATSLFLERLIVYVEISEFEIITSTCRVFKTRTTFWNHILF